LISTISSSSSSSKIWKLFTGFFAVFVGACSCAGFEFGSVLVWTFRQFF